MNRVLFFLSLIFVFCFFVSGNVLAEEADFEKEIDEVVLHAKNGSEDAKRFLFISSAFDVKYAKYLIEIIDKNQNDYFFQALLAECYFATGAEEKGFKLVKTLSADSGFGGNNKYLLAGALLVNASETQNEKYFEEALKMYVSLQDSGYREVEMEELNKNILICIKGTPQRKKFMEGKVF